MFFFSLVKIYIFLQIFSPVFITFEQICYSTYKQGNQLFSTGFRDPSHIKMISSTLGLESFLISSDHCTPLSVLVWVQGLAHFQFSVNHILIACVCAFSEKFSAAQGHAFV